MLPKVSIPIATYNRAEYLAECLESVLAQTYKNIEIIVVDDGSTDETAEVAARFGKKISYVRHEQNQGNIHTYYHARSLCTGKYMTYFGDDDLLSNPEHIERGIEILESDPSIVKFCCDWYMIDSKGDRIGNGTHLQNYALTSGKKTIDDLLEKGCFVHCGIDRREIFEKIGYFDKNFPHAADYDMYLRMTGNGYSIYYLNEPLGSYRIHPGMRSHNESEMWEETIKVLELNLQRFPEAKERLNSQLNRKLGMNKAWLAVRLFWEKEFSKSFSYALSATKNYLPAVPLGALQMTYSALKNKRSVYQLGD